MYSSIRSYTFTKDTITSESSRLILEIALEIVINGASNTMIMFTPVGTQELVTGFIFTEGLIDGVSEILECSISSSEGLDGDQVIEAQVKISSENPNLSGVQTKRVSYSSCGICGKENFYDMKKGLGRVKSRHRFSIEVLEKLPAKLQEHQPLYQMTGGAHAAVLFSSEGNPLLLYEDMGRHNALDKVIGATLIQGISCEDKILLSSGRASLEMMLKTARAGIPVFIAMSRPTSKAVEAAKFYNITLIDMAKNSNRVYSHARRIEGF